MCNQNQSENYRKLRGKLQDAVNDLKHWLGETKKLLLKDFNSNKSVSVKEKAQRYGLLIAINKIHIEFTELDQLTLTCETPAGLELQSTIFEDKENESFFLMLERVEGEIKKSAKGQNLIKLNDIKNIFNNLKDAVQQFSKI